MTGDRRSRLSCGVLLSPTSLLPKKFDWRAVWTQCVDKLSQLFDRPGEIQMNRTERQPNFP